MISGEHQLGLVTTDAELVRCLPNHRMRLVGTRAQVHSRPSFTWFHNEKNIGT